MLLIVGEFNPSFELHAATDAALVHSSAAHSLAQKRRSRSNRRSPSSSVISVPSVVQFAGRSFRSGSV
jgi:hypothetical protein